MAGYLGTKAVFLSTTAASVGGDATIGGDLNVSGGLNTTDVLPSADNTSDLGSTAKRYQDLYLSGGLYVGGTGSANKLDDYEEGTWTAADGSGAGLTFSLVNNTYTKVGRVVTCAANITWPSTSDTGLARVTLPFTALPSSSQHGGVVIEQNYSGAETLTAAVNYTDGIIFRSRGTSAISNAGLSGKKLRFLVTYHAA